MERVQNLELDQRKVKHQVYLSEFQRPSEHNFPHLYNHDNKIPTPHGVCQGQIKLLHERGLQTVKLWTHP